MKKIPRSKWWMTIRKTAFDFRIRILRRARRKNPGLPGKFRSRRQCFPAIQIAMEKILAPVHANVILRGHF
jgi:hypothetical protein